jgi:hypothetical protein
MKSTFNKHPQIKKQKLSCDTGVRSTSVSDEFIVELEGTRFISGSVVENFDGMAVYCNPVLKYINYEGACFT